MGFLDQLKTTGILLGAEKATKKGDHTRALQLYTELIDIRKKSNDSESLSNAHILRAITFYNDLKDFSSALVDIDKAIELSPQNDEHFAKRALVLGLCSKDDAAIENINKALSINPNNSQAKQLLQYLKNS